MIPSPPPPRRHSRRRRVLLVVAGCLVLPAVLVAIAPRLASLPPLRSLLAWRLGSALGGRVEISDVSWRWSGDLHLGAGRLKAAGGAVSMTWERLEGRISVVHLIQGRISGRLSLHRPQIDLAYSPGGPDLLALSEPLFKQLGRGSAQGLNSGLTITGGTLRLVDTQLQTEARFVDLNARVVWPGKGALTLDLSTQLDDAAGGGSIRGSVSLERNVSGGLDLSRCRAALDCDLHDVAIAPLRGLLAPLLGVHRIAGHLEAQLHATVDGREGTVLEGDFDLRRLVVEGGPFTDRPLRLTQVKLDSRLRLDLRAGTLDVPRFSLSSGPLSILVRDGALRVVSRRLMGSLTLELHSQFARIASDLRGLIGRTRDFGGRLELLLAVIGDRSETGATLTLDLRHAVYLDRTVAEDPMELKWLHVDASGQIGPGGDWLTVDRLHAESDPLVIDDLAGQITAPVASPELDLGGRVQIDLDRVTEQILPLLAPGAVLAGNFRGTLSARTDERAHRLVVDGSLENGYGEYAGLLRDGIPLPPVGCRMEIDLARNGRSVGAGISLAGEGLDLEAGAERVRTEDETRSSTPGFAWDLDASAEIDLGKLPGLAGSRWPESLEPTGRLRAQGHLRVEPGAQGPGLSQGRWHAALEAARLRHAASGRETLAMDGELNIRQESRPGGAPSTPALQVSARLTAGGSSLRASGSLDPEMDGAGRLRGWRPKITLQGEASAGDLTTFLGTLAPGVPPVAGGGLIELSGTTAGRLWGPSGASARLECELGSGLVRVGATSLKIDKAALTVSESRITLNELNATLDRGSVTGTASMRRLGERSVAARLTAHGTRPGPDLRHLLALICPLLFVGEDGELLRAPGQVDVRIDVAARTIESDRLGRSLLGTLEASLAGGNLPPGTIAAAIVAPGQGHDPLELASVVLRVTIDHDRLVLERQTLVISGQTLSFEGSATLDGGISIRGEASVTGAGTESRPQPFRLTGTLAHPRLVLEDPP